MEQADKIRAFKMEVARLCRKHGLSIAHEDEHGSFMIVEWSTLYEEWFLGANYDYECTLEPAHSSSEVTDA